MLKQRIFTAAFALVVVIGILLAGKLPWQVFVWLGSLLGMQEFIHLLGVRWNRLPAWWGYVVVTVVQWIPTWNRVISLELLSSVSLLLPVLLKNRFTLEKSAAVLLGSLYIAFGGGALSQIRALPDGRAWVLLFLVSIWMTDTAAFFIGSRVKGPKLWPAISPGKTISGSLGGLVGGVVGAVLIGAILLARDASLGRFVLVGLVISLAGQLGDLVESAYKRSAGVKDSGNLLPGHGGVLDRIDSILFAAPFAYFLIAFGAPGTWF